MFETMGIDNVNSWISGGGFVGVVGSLAYNMVWCKIKLKSQCSTITELKKDMEKKADEKAVDKMDAKNDEAHNRLFDQINDLPQKIIDLMK